VFFLLACEASCGGADACSNSAIACAHAASERFSGNWHTRRKTPSMQLLARQRIPRLEAEIKQLVAELQARA
jgi:hypothetical protein